MRFWTALQYPLCQAALVEDGVIVRRIPEKPPNTPARRVGLVAEFDNQLVVGRRNSIELWDRQGQELLKSVYHPWIYSLHACRQLGNRLLLGCATLDVVFTLDFEGESDWQWWAHRDGLAKEPAFIHDDDWQTRQLTQNISHETAHLNSVRLDHGGTILVTLLRPGVVVRIDLASTSPKSKVVRRIETPDIHDYQVAGGAVVYGTRNAFVVDGSHHNGFEYVKRIERLSGDRFLLTHEQGVTTIEPDGRHLMDWTLPRPFRFRLSGGIGLRWT